MPTESRETAYIYAIQSAGVMYSVTRACATGALEGCGCDDTVRKKDTRGQFEWGGCSEDLQFGSKFAEDFVDTADREAGDTPDFSLMNLWNNKAGRLVSGGNLFCYNKTAIKKNQSHVAYGLVNMYKKFHSYEPLNIRRL